jgi:hypothetical protein
MRRYLLVALWPAGLAAIGAATAFAARRASASAAPAARVRAGLADAAVVAAAQATLAGRPPARRLPAALRRASGQGGSQAPAGSATGQPGWAADLVKLGVASCADGALSYAVMALIGPLVINRGPAIDEPIFRWTSSHQVKRWADVLWRLNKIGNTWTTWGAAGTAAVCLAVTWHKQRWLPPAVLAAAIVVDHYATLALRHTFNRPGPPTSPLGTYPAGGTDRVILFYGLIAHLLWREFSGSPRGKAWAIGTVAALAFNQAYCREYLSRHWFTDILSGLVYGVVLLLPFMAAIRLIAGPAQVPGLDLPALASTAA